jgi:hypothetical protein
MAVIDIEYGREILEESGYQGYSKNEGQEVLELEMVLQNASYGHEYALQELTEAKDLFQKEDLLSKIENYKRAYFMARRYLKKNNPDRLKQIESELLEQKNRVFGTYHA